MAPGQFDDGDDYPRSSLGQPESMRNEEQRLRDNQGGSELTNRPDDHPVGAPGETASAEAEGPPPDREAGRDAEDTENATEPADTGSDARGRERGTERGDERGLHPGKNADIAAPVRSAGPSESTLPEESPLGRTSETGGPDAGDKTPPATSAVAEARRLEERLRNTGVGPGGEIVPEEERGE